MLIFDNICMLNVYAMNIIVLVRITVAYMSIIARMETYTQLNV